ncbi:MAG: hypothetical protein Q7R62_02545 [bacterium]|nr:hypothetical protein [bacterium]
MRKCAICEKTSRMAGTRILLRGHYNPTNWTRKYPNLQSIRMPMAKAGFTQGESVLACTQCIRTFGKTTRIEKKAVIKKELAARSTSSGQAKEATAPAPEKKVEVPRVKKEKTAPKAKKETK